MLDGPAGAASALKVAYAAYTKGTAALLLAIRALAVQEGVDAGPGHGVGAIAARSPRAARGSRAGQRAQGLAVRRRNRRRARPPLPLPVCPTASPRPLPWCTGAWSSTRTRSSRPPRWRSRPRCAGGSSGRVARDGRRALHEKTWPPDFCEGDGFLGTCEVGIGQEQAGSIQRWRDRHHHHHHGAGAEGAARRDLDGAAAVDPGVPQLCAELRLRRHLLEQPPPHAARVSQGDGADAVGQPASAVLAVAVSLRHGLDGREPFRRGAIGASMAWCC